MPKYLITITNTYTILADDMAEALAIAEENNDLGYASDSTDIQGELIGPNPGIKPDSFNSFEELLDYLSRGKGQEDA